MITLDKTGYAEVDRFSDTIIHLFKDRIVGLIFYGSNAFNRSRGTYSDFDLHLMLKYSNTTDYSKLKKVLENFDNIDFTVQYLSDIESKGWENYQFGNHGVFYIEMLSYAIPIYGQNIFKTISIGADLMNASLSRQIEEHLWRIDQWILSYSPISKEGHYKFLKYFCRVSIHMMIIDNTITFEEANYLNDKEFISKKLLLSDIFSHKTKELMAKLVQKGIKSTDELQELRTALYSDFLNLL